VITRPTASTNKTHSQVGSRSDRTEDPGRLRTIASSEAGGGSMRGTSTDSGESSRDSGGGGK